MKEIKQVQHAMAASSAASIAAPLHAMAPSYSEASAAPPSSEASAAPRSGDTIFLWSITRCVPLKLRLICAIGSHWIANLQWICFAIPSFSQIFVW